MIVGVLRQLFGRPASPRPETRLTESEALTIAQTALNTASLFVRDVVTTADGVEWRVATQTKGSGAFVRIADATGAVLEQGRWGIR